MPCRCASGERAQCAQPSGSYSWYMAGCRQREQAGATFTAHDLPASAPFTYDGCRYDVDRAPSLPPCAFSRVRTAIALFSLPLLREVAIAPLRPPPDSGPTGGRPDPDRWLLTPDHFAARADHFSSYPS